MYCVNIITQYKIWGIRSIDKCKTYKLLYEKNNFLNYINSWFLQDISRGKHRSEEHGGQQYLLKLLLFKSKEFDDTSKLFRCPGKSTEQVRKDSLKRKQECLNFVEKFKELIK